MPQLDPIREARRQWVAHGWDDAAPGMAMVTSIVRVHQLLMERIDAALRPHDLTFARYEILRLLAFTKFGALPMTRLGSLLQVHPTSVTSAVDRLEKQGFVRRSRGETDKR
ncbi:MarR family transcriptional regulator, partial [Nocardioides sp. CER28]